MKLSRIAVNGILVTTLGSFCLGSSAQGADFSDCSSIVDREDRYTCYDSVEANSKANAQGAEAGRAAQNGASENLPVIRRPRRAEQAVSGGTSPNETDDQVDDFGLENETAEARILEGEDGKSELIDTIAEIEMLGQELRLITLSSGQRWQQMETGRYYLKEGEEVRIYPSIWGSSYRLTSSRLRGYIQVKRID